MATIYAPVSDYEGLSAGVEFTGGQATTNDPTALAYFEQAGYRVVHDARDSGITRTRTRDAAVDPRPSDYLPPLNAGLDDPHGPNVVAPGIHGGSGSTRPVKPGPVSDTPTVQDTAESNDAADKADLEGQAPKGNAAREAWADYATSLGVEVTEHMTRVEIRVAVADKQG